MFVGGVQSLSRVRLSRVRLFNDPMDCSLPASSVLGISPGRNTGVGCHFLLPNPGSKPVSPTLVGGFFTTAPPGKPAKHTAATTKTMLFKKGC